MTAKMGALVTMEVKGIKEALADIAKYDQKIQLAVEAAIEKGVKNIGEAAQNRAPVKSGKLKKSGRAKFNKATMTGYASFSARYAHIVEFGSVTSPAQPFLFPSFQEEVPQVEKEIREAIKTP
jgi:HK97 gp10 family phage protein